MSLPDIETIDFNWDEDLTLSNLIFRIQEQYTLNEMKIIAENLFAGIDKFDIFNEEQELVFNKDQWPCELAFDNLSEVNDIRAKEKMMLIEFKGV